MTATCPECLESFDPGRADQVTCSNACRQRRYRRGGSYVVTDEDRAAIRRAAGIVPIPIPLPTLTPEQVRQHILATATREGEQDNTATTRRRP
jgi:hypothetical protein